jgi:preprotein translocase subunit SecD
MMYFARWKTAAILAICLLGVLVSLPNLLPRAAFPEWLPARQVNLGLDLRGGSYLLLEVETSVLLRERLEGLVEGTRRGLTQANPRIAYTGLSTQLDQRRIQLRVTDTAQRETAQRLVRELANPVNVGGGATQPDIDVAISPGRPADGDRHRGRGCAPRPPAPSSSPSRSSAAASTRPAWPRR